MPNKTGKEEAPEQKNKEEKPKTTRIPLQIIPNDDEEVAEEMQRIFDEDKVVHRHGSSEPESD